MDVKNDFSVCAVFIDELSMFISKNGVTIELNENEIKEMLSCLPKNQMNHYKLICMLNESNKNNS